MTRLLIALHLAEVALAHWIATAGDWWLIHAASRLSRRRGEFSGQLSTTRPRVEK